MNYQETIDYLYAQLPQYQNIGEKAFKPSLANIEKLCTALENPENKFPAVHIAGTNGKGSSAHMIASVLQVAGHKTGLYTSPHLLSFRERIKINGIEISEEAVVAFVKNYQNLMQDIEPSFFEITVAMAFWEFARQKVDIAVIEVGLGGRFDATNVITPLVSLITNIGYDHQNILGETLAQIAFEKAGIIKSKIPVVISERQKEIEKVFVDKARKVQADIFFAEDEFRIQRKLAGNFDIFRNDKLYIEDLRPDLKGIYQVKNILGVCQVLDILEKKNLRLNNLLVKEGLKKTVIQTKIQGRWQVLQKKPLIICDTAHNRDALQILIQDLLAQNKPLHVVLGFAKDKKWQILLDLFPKNAYYYFCKFDSIRSLSVNLLVEEGKSKKLRYISGFQTVIEAFMEAKKNARENDLIFVGGSTFVVADFLKSQKNLLKYK